MGTRCVSGFLLSLVRVRRVRARVLRVGVAVTVGRLDGLRRFPTGAFEHGDGVANGDGEIRALQFSEDGEVDADDATRLAEQWSARAALGCARVVDDPVAFERRDAALRRQRFDQIAFGEVSDQYVERRSETLLDEVRVFLRQ